MPTTARGRETEAAFLEGARRVFAEKGYLNAKIVDIARAAGRSAGSFYNYYDNKEELLERLLDQFTDEVLDTASCLRRGHDPYGDIVAAVRAYWTGFRAYLPEMVGLFQLSMTDEGYARRWREHRAAAVRGIVDAIGDLHRSGCATGVDGGVVASALVSMLESFCWVWMVAGGDIEVERPDDEVAITTLATVWYRTLYSPAPDGPPPPRARDAAAADRPAPDVRHADTAV